jgi:hypothetical protein
MIPHVEVMPNRNLSRRLFVLPISAGKANRLVESPNLNITILGEIGGIPLNKAEYCCSRQHHIHLRQRYPLSLIEASSKAAQGRR